MPMGQSELVDAPEGQAGHTGVSAKILKNMGLTDEDIKKYATKEAL